MGSQMKRRKLLVCAAVVLAYAAALALLSGCGAGEGREGQIAPPGGGEHGAKADGAGETATKVEVGYAAPDFEVELLGGGSAKLSDYRGRAVLINFWATWCGPCVGEMPDLQRLSEAFEGELAVVAVNCSEKEEKVGAFISDNGYTFDVGLDEGGAVQKKYPTNGIPYTIIVDPAGIITAIHLGASSDMFSVYEKDINAALGK